MIGRNRKLPGALSGRQPCVGWTRAGILIYASLVDNNVAGPIAEAT